MNRMFIYFSLVFWSLFLSSASSEAARYVITPLTNSYYNGYQQLNNRGEIAWLRHRDSSSGSWDLVLFKNGQTHDIAVNIDCGSEIPSFHLNNHGQVVWFAYDAAKIYRRIFLYDNGITRQISDPNYDAIHPWINNKGEVVWLHNDNGLYLLGYYSNGSLAYISNDKTPNNATKSNIQINDNSWIAWAENTQTAPKVYQYLVYLYKGNSIIQMGPNLASSLSLNNNNQMAWANDKRIIYLYSNDLTNPITNGDFQKTGLQLNDQGYVVWASQGQNGDMEIYAYFNGSTRQIVRAGDDGNPQANNLGQIVWQGMTDGYYNVFLYNYVTMLRITNNNNAKMSPLINDMGQIVWSEVIGADYQIVLATPVVTRSNLTSAIFLLLVD